MLTNYGLGKFLSILTFVFSSTEIDDMLRKSTNLLLTRILSSCLLNLIRKPHIGLTEVRRNNIIKCSIWKNWGRRDCSEKEHIINCSCRGPGLDFHHTHGSS